MEPLLLVLLALAGLKNVYRLQLQCEVQEKPLRAVVGLLRLHSEVEKSSSHESSENQSVRSDGHIYR